LCKKCLGVIGGAHPSRSSKASSVKSIAPFSCENNPLT
jgi:hypothetical protein